MLLKLRELLQSWRKKYFILFQKVHFFCLHLIKMKVFHFTIVDVFFCCFFASANLIITDPKNYFHDLRTFVHSTIPSTFSHLNFSVAWHSIEERHTKWEKIPDEVKMRGRFLLKVSLPCWIFLEGFWFL